MKKRGFGMGEENQELRDRLRGYTGTSQTKQQTYARKFSGDDLKELLKGSDSARLESGSHAADPRSDNLTYGEKPGGIEDLPPVRSALSSFSEYDDEPDMSERFRWTRESRKARWRYNTKILLFAVILISLIDGRPYQALSDRAFSVMTQPQTASREKSKQTYSQAIRLSKTQQPWYAQKPASSSAQSWPVIEPAAQSETPSSTADQKTTLRSEVPEGKFVRGNVTTLVSVKARVRNVGSVSARQIRVATRLPSGVRIELNGPAELAAGESATYTADTNQIVTVAGNLQMEQSCENCRK